MKLHRLAVATLLATSAVAAHAEFTVSPMVGFHVYDSDTINDHSNNEALRNRQEGSVALGYRPIPSVGLELRYGLGHTSATNVGVGGANDVQRQTGTLDAYYRFNTDGKFQPYLLIGGGIDHTKFRSISGQPANAFDGSERHTVANAAVGAFYQLNRYLALRGEVREVEDLQSSLHDGIVSLGVVLGTGAKEKHAVAPVVLPPVAVDGDDDGDGVPNSRDKCPGTPRNVVVDANGCSKVLTETVTKELHVLFDTNKSVVKPAYNAEIEGVAKLLKEYPTATVEIQGHTDSTGPAKLNEKLSQARATAVADVLSKTYGIDASRITAKGYGPSMPVADNKTSAGRAKNRRVVAVAAGEVKVTVKK